MEGLRFWTALVVGWSCVEDGDDEWTVRGWWFDDEIVGEYALMKGW